MVPWSQSFVGGGGSVIRTVLLVLRSEDFCQALQDVLKYRYRVISAKSAEEGAVMLQRQPDALLLDLFLPGTDGLSFLKENQTKLPPAILLFTTFHNSYILQAASDLGVTTVLLKPCPLASVQNWLDTQP